jgi:Ca-activated chloride channel family protein
MIQRHYLYLLLSLLILLISAGKSRADLDRSKVKEGIKAYQKSEWDNALQKFQDALLDDPENPVGHYNVGQAFYKKQNYEEALASYEKALNTPDAELREKIYYNQGNTYYQLNKYQESIQSYIKALELNPDDQDAKHNLELVRAKLKEMAQKQPQQNQQQQQQQPGDQQQQSGQNKEQQPNQQQQKQQQQEKAQADQEKKEKNKQEDQNKSQQSIEKKKPLTKEEAERILQALRSDEKKNQKLRREKTTAGKAHVEKDW